MTHSAGFCWAASTTIPKWICRLLTWCLLAAGLLSAGVLAATPRERQRLDDGWLFALGDAPGAHEAAFDASAWHSVSLPHDWSISLPIDPAAPAAGAGGFFLAGVGWYRRVVSAPQAWAGRRIAIEFEGAYMNAEVWINGTPLGRHPYGYTPFHLELTPYLKLGSDNILSVRIDNSALPNSRWYTGSGLYRPVWLHVTDGVQVDADGVSVSTTELSERRAGMQIRAVIRNETVAPSAVVVEVEIVDTEQHTVATGKAEGAITAGGEVTVTPNLEITHPCVWTPDSPVLYRAVTRVRTAGRVVDEVTTVFGVRTVRVSAERGFELNGQQLKLLGGNVHHDNGPLGAAAFARAEERKVELLKAAGFNAVRTSHNPPSVAFLDACDRLGLLVMDEIFDGWEKAKNPHDYSVYFKEWWQRDVDAWVRRDRNHPSVVLWSTGNEMFERGNAAGQRIAHELVARIRALDSTRPVSAGVNGMGKNGDWAQLDPLFAAFDVAGYNYELARHASDHTRWPTRVMIAAESYQTEAFANWTAMHDNSYVIGDFVWSALDYLGEAGIGRVFPPGEPVKKHWEANMFPWHGAYCGDIDLTGWRKSVSHYRNIVWDRGEKLYAAVRVPVLGGKEWNVTPWSVPPALPAWTWLGHEGETMTVEVYSRHEAVRLTLNGRVMGEKPTTQADEFKAVFAVPYAPGELRVMGLDHGQEVETSVLRTAREATELRLTVDRANLRADGQDLAFVTVEALDEKGVWNPQAMPVVSFSIEGPGSLAAIGTGDMTSMESYQGASRQLFQGRALAVVRTVVHGGEIVLTARAPGLAAARLVLKSEQPQP